MPGYAWADGELAELAEQVGKMVEHHRSKSNQTNYPSGCPTLYVGCSYLLFWLLVGLRQDEVDVDAEVMLGQELVLVVPLETGRRVVDESLALKDRGGICGCDMFPFTK